MLKESIKSPIFTDGFRLIDLLCQSYPPHCVVLRLELSSRCGQQDFRWWHWQFETFQTQRASTNWATHSGHEIRDQQVPCSCAVHQVSRREKRCKGERHIFLAWVVEVQLWIASSLFFCVASVADKRPQLLPSGTSLQHVQCHFWRGSEKGLRGLPWAGNAVAVQQTQSLSYFCFVCVCVWWDIYLYLSSSPSACAGCVCAVDMRIESILVEYWRNFEWFGRGLNRLFGRFLQ